MCVSAHAEEVCAEKVCKTEACGEKVWTANGQRTNVLYALYGGQWMQDSYLSPLVYDGWQAGLGNEWWNTFRKNDLWRHTGILQGYAGKVTQSSRHNEITHFDIQAGWGAHRVWGFDTGRPKGTDGSRVEVYAGPFAELDFMAKELARNVNKPYSFDMGADVDLMIGANYSFRYKKTAYRLVYEGRINGLGVMWLPDYWQSYYETTEKVNLGGSVAFSHPGNRQFVHQQLSMDFQFKRSTWRLGAKHEYLHYGDKDRHFARQTVSLTVGCIFNCRVTGTKF